MIEKIPDWMFTAITLIPIFGALDLLLWSLLPKDGDEEDGE